MKSRRLAERIAEKAEKEAARKKELELRKEQERLAKIRKREERMKRIADNQAALQKKEKEKLMKIKEGKTVSLYILYQCVVCVLFLETIKGPTH